MPTAIQANELIERWSAERPAARLHRRLHAACSTADGRPRADLFLADALHLNAAGYALWQAAIAEHLR